MIPIHPDRSDAQRRAMFARMRVGLKKTVPSPKFRSVRKPSRVNIKSPGFFRRVLDKLKSLIGNRLGRRNSN